MRPQQKNITLEELKTIALSKNWTITSKQIINRSTPLSVRCICGTERSFPIWWILSKPNKCRCLQEKRKCVCGKDVGSRVLFCKDCIYEKKRNNLFEINKADFVFFIESKKSVILNIEKRTFFIQCKNGHQFTKQDKPFIKTPWCVECVELAKRNAEENKQKKQSLRKKISKQEIEIWCAQKRWLPTFHRKFAFVREKIKIQCSLCSFSWKPFAQQIVSADFRCPNCAGVILSEKITGIIYKATAPDGKIYIGQTLRSLMVRIKQHKKSSLNKNNRKYYFSKFMSAIRQYGTENFKWEILYQDVPWNELSKLEMTEIEKHNSFSVGLNSTPGGQGVYKNARIVSLAAEKENVLAQLRKEKQQRFEIKLFEQNVSKKIKKFFKGKNNQPETEIDKIYKKIDSSIRRSIETKQRFENGFEKSSLFRGVCWNKLNKKWQVNIKVSGKKLYLGLFVDENEAAREYDRAAKQYFGAAAKLNFKN